MKFFLATLLAFYCLASFAQKETSNWFFTQNAVSITPGGVNTTVPQPDWQKFGAWITNTSVSDAAGNLLFACGANTIIDRDLAVMPGLNNISLYAGQGTTLAQKIPGSSRYLVFYNSSNQFNSVNSNWTLKYAVVDMSLNSGKGDVTAYDQVVDTAISMGFTLVQGDNTEDAWLVTHRPNTDSFINYPVTAAGLGTTPVISKAGSYYVKENYNFKTLKTSYNGKMVAGVDYKSSYDYQTILSEFIEVFNFDAATGLLSSKIRTGEISIRANDALSLEFSPDNRLLYHSEVSSAYGLQPCGFGSSYIVQYNLCYTDSAEFVRYAPGVAADFVWCGPGITFGRMQLGADRRIHVPYNGTMVSAFNHPNHIGTSVDFVFDSYNLPQGNNGFKATPSFQHRMMEKAVKNNIVYSGGCYPTPMLFRVTNDTINTISWNFGDPSGTGNIVSQKAPSHVFSAPGIYQVIAQLFNSQNSLIETVTETVEVKDPTRRLLAAYPKDVNVCQGTTFNIKLSVVNGIFAWYRLGFDGQKSFEQVADSISVAGGTWYVEMRQNDCDLCRMVDSIHITVLPKPDFNLGYDRSICKGDTILLTAWDSTASYSWSTGETGIDISVTKGGTYWLQGEYDNNGCPFRDSVLLTDAPSVRFSLPADTTLCNDQPLVLSPGIGTGYYYWQDNSHDSIYTVTQSGTYWVNVYSADFYCMHTDTIEVKYINARQVFLGNDTSLCAGGTLTLQPDIANAQYLWSTGSTGNQLTVNSTGNYWIQVNNGNCTVTDTIRVVFNSPPVVNLGRDTALCPKQSLQLSTVITNAVFQWQDGSASNNFKVASPGTYWLQVQKDGCTVRDSINVNYYPPEQLLLGPDIRLCTGSDTLLKATGNFTQYSWSTGATGAGIIVSAPGNYIATATTARGCKVQDTIALLPPYPLPLVQLNHSTTICEGDTRILDAGNGFTGYLWNDGSTAATRTVSSTGVYSVTVTDNKGCRGADSVAISKIVPLPANFLPADTALCSYATVNLAPIKSFTEYLWNTSATTAAIVVSKPGTYSLTVTDQYNCKGTDQVIISPKDCMLGLYVPTAFSPDNNGKNDAFKPMLFGNVVKYDFAIYNRYGQTVFRSAKQGESWDGSFKGSIQPGGAYVWTCSYQLSGQGLRFAKGTVMIVK